MKAGKSFYLARLWAEFSGRTERNPRYSLRSFARDLGMNSGSLSQILSGHRIPRPALSAKIATKLNLETAEKRVFINSSASAPRLVESTLEQEFTSQTASIEQDKFEAIAAWYYSAILESTYLDDFQNSAEWISKRLGITEIEGRSAIDRLKRLGLLKEENGCLRKTSQHLTTFDKAATTTAHRQHQTAFLRLAAESVTSLPVDKRVSSGITMAIDADKLEIARDMIQSFARELCTVLETGKRHSVARLQINLFPIDHETKDKC